VVLRILDLNIDTGGAMGELILTMIGGIAQFERRIMLERQREGIARAKADGKYTGRKPTARAKAEKVRALLKSGMGATEVAKAAEISRRSVYRIMQDATAE
jgi:DNA invertase Pin-like site-specific DNA recombinase